MGRSSRIWEKWKELRLNKEQFRRFNGFEQHIISFFKDKMNIHFTFPPALPFCHTLWMAEKAYRRGNINWIPKYLDLPITKLVNNFSLHKTSKAWNKHNLAETSHSLNSVHSPNPIKILRQWDIRLQLGVAFCCILVIWGVTSTHKQSGH
jgi:hypothetical protein